MGMTHQATSHRNVAASGGKWIRQDKRLAIYLRDGMECVYCGAKAEDGTELCLDHLRPQVLGGTNDESNLVTCCRHCNSAKGAKSLAEFVASLPVDAGELRRRIRNQTRRSLRRYRRMAKDIIRTRRQGA